MADDNIAIQPTTQQTGPITLIKTFKVKGPDGSDVEAQAVIVVDEFGDAIQPMLSEATGQKILSMLINIHNVLAESTGAALQMPTLSVSGDLGLGS